MREEIMWMIFLLVKFRLIYQLRLADYTHGHCFCSLRAWTNGIQNTKAIRLTSEGELDTRIAMHLSPQNSRKDSCVRGDISLCYAHQFVSSYVNVFLRILFTPRFSLAPSDFRLHHLSSYRDRGMSRRKSTPIRNASDKGSRATPFSHIPCFPPHPDRSHLNH